MSLYTILSQTSHLPPTLLIFLTPPILISLLLLSTFLYTHTRYYLSLHRASTSTSTSPTAPPQIPYTVPFLGSALSFLASYPSSFWTYIFSFHPRSTGCFTLLLGGRQLHILFSPLAIQTLFRHKDLGRDGFNREIVMKGLGNSAKDADLYFGIEGEGKIFHDMTPKEFEEKFNVEWLLKAERVNELTAEFTRSLRRQVTSALRDDSRFKDGGEEFEIGIYEFIKPIMFAASTASFFGSSVLDICPDLCAEFFAFDRVMLKLFFGVPAIFARKEITTRQKILDSLLHWHQVIHAKYHGNPIDPFGDVSWEPDYGCKANRLKQMYYEKRGITLQARAGFDLGFLFGLSSNAIPATGWILMHLLDPHGDLTLLPRLLDELATARKGENGDFDIPTLTTLPLLQSILQETLRLYVDAYVTRELFHDLILPLEDGKRALFRKNSVLMAPSYVAHHDDSVWCDPPAKFWYAERFLRIDPETGKQVFSTSIGMDHARKIFPFGGGKAICPGRVFAKQEVLGAVAVFLTEFEFKGVRYQGSDGEMRDKFPGLGKGYGGAVVVNMEGDVRVRVRRGRTGR